MKPFLPNILVLSSKNSLESEIFILNPSTTTILKNKIINNEQSY